VKEQSSLGIDRSYYCGHSMANLAFVVHQNCEHDEVTGAIGECEMLSALRSNKR